jgi:hypothetical protein
MEKTNNGEIDLADIFKSIGSSIRKFFNNMLLGLAKLRRTAIQYRSFFIGINLIGLGFIAFQVFSSFGTKYTSTMIIRCDYLNLQILKSSIEKLNSLCRENDRVGLSELLSLNKEAALSIINFEVSEYLSEADLIEVEVLKEQLNNVMGDKKGLAEKVIKKIDIANRQTYKISVSVKDPMVVKKLDTVLVNHFKTMPYVQKRIESHKLTLKVKRDKLIRESQKLDSLKTVLFDNFRTMAKQSREGSNNVILSDKYLTDPLNVFREDLNIHNEIQIIDQELRLSPDFEVIDGLTTFRNPSNLRLSIRIIITLSIATVAGFVLIGLWNFNNYLASLTAKSQA